MENAKFVWNDPHISAQCDEMERKLTAALNGSVGVAPFLVELVNLTMNEKSQRELGQAPEHNNESHAVFYNNLFNAILTSIQEPTEKNMLLSSMFSYLDRIEYAGCAPMNEHRPALAGDISLGSVEPVFDIWCQDEDILPLSTLAARVSVTREGEVRTVILNAEWLTASQPAQHEEAEVQSVKVGIKNTTRNGGGKQAKKAKAIKH